MLTRFFLLLALVLTACTPTEHHDHRPVEFSGTAMTMSYRILAGHKLNDQDVEKIQELIVSTFTEVHSIYNIWNPESEISQLNEQPGNTWTTLSPELEKLLLITGELVEVTHGFFDPTITSAYQLWTKKLEAQTLPSNNELEQLQQIVGWNKIKVREGRFWKSHKEVKLDLGGIAKGYCVDLLTERLIEHGYVNCYVEWGGEIRANGKHPDQRPWNVYISNLSDVNPDHALAIVSLFGEALATSGDYLQQWTYDLDDGSSCTYTHVIDPMTLTPIKVTQHNICSATVKARTCTEADALATAVMICSSVPEAEKWTEQLRNKFENSRFWFVTRKELTE